MKIFTLLMTLLCFGQYAIAQDTELFVLYADSGTQKKVIGISKDTSELIVTDKIHVDNFFDAFIIKPSIDNPNTVFIIAAKENNLFLKRNGNTLEFTTIKEDATATDRDPYEWEIQYLGFPFVTINDPANLRRVVYMQNNELQMKVVPDADWNLSNNDDTRAKTYRYKINKIKNTF